jgi:uncharacterized protein (TIRG00374 family)
MKHLLSFVLGAAIAVAALAYALSKVDLTALGRQLAGGNYGLVPAFLVLQTAYFLVTAVNWTLLLRPLGRYSLRQVLPTMFLGFGGNNVLPAHLGELVRAVAFARQFKRPTGAVLASLVLERVLDVLAILVFYFLAVRITRTLPDSIRTGAEVVAALIVPFCLALFLFLRYPGPFLRLWAWGSAWMPLPLRRKGTSLLEGVVKGLSAMDSLPHVAGMIGLSLLKWTLGTGMIWLSLRAFGVTVTPGAAMIVLAVSALAVSLPSAPGYVGTLQASFVFALAPFGIASEVAFAASVFYMVVLWVPVTTAGLVSFLALGLKMNQLRQEVERAESGPGAG